MLNSSSRTRGRAVLLVFLWGVLGCACAVPQTAPANESRSGAEIRPARIEAHMRFLADDLLEGREAGTRGYDLAAAYVASQFRSIGLQPAGDDGRFLQAVPLQAYWLVRDGTRMIVRPRGGGPAVRLTLGDDYVAAPSPTRERSAVTAPAVFAGYGIDAPAFDHDDYSGLDVSGKIVVVLAGYPSSFPSEEGAHYGSTREKQRIAAAHGAVGIVAIYTERFERVAPWDRFAGRLDSMSMTWVDRDGQPFEPAPALQAGALLSPEDGTMLFEGAPMSYQQVREQAANGAPKGFPLAVSLEIAQQSRHERRSSANVAGVLEGSDERLRGEHVVMVGHLDHEGVGPAVDGDAIYNGALDNAAGIAGLLEAARALASGPAPRRSVLFLAVTAEEKGLLGSEYFALNPTVPRGSIVASVNLDMPLLLYDFRDVIAFGAEHSSLKDQLESTVRAMNLTLTPDPMPEAAVFTRSDHYRFVQQGIPSVSLTTGWNSDKGEGEGGRVFRDFLARHYHRPSDDLQQPIDFEAGARFARVNYLLLEAIANSERRPAWNEGNFFANLFASGDAGRQ